MQLVPNILWGQSSCSFLSTIPIIDSIVATPQKDTTYYYKRNFFDFGETYKDQKSLDNSLHVNSLPQDLLSKQNVSFNIKEVDRSKYVGQIPYTHDVTPTGGKSYTIPIETVVTNGVCPQISISYNSQSGNELLGIGWGLSGLSSITIVNKNIYFDGEVSAPKSADSNFAFMLDGVRLVPSEKLYGYPLETTQGQILVQPVYSEKYKSAIRYFRVLYPNGTKATYGIDNNKSETAYTYLINSLEDIKGYRIDFEYTQKNQGIDYISRIKYGGREVNSHPSKIEFQYIDRNDTPTSFMLGHQINTNQLLTKIISYNDNEELRSYTLTYDLNDICKLTKIDCSVGSLFLNPLIFKYGLDHMITRPDELIRSEQMLLTTYFSSSSDMVYQRGRFIKNDYNEGLIIYPHFSNYGLLLEDKFMGHTYRQYGSKYSPDQAILIAPKLSSLSNVKTIYAGEGFQQLSCADVDGDGIDEFIQLNIAGCYTNGNCALKVTILKNTPTGFSSNYRIYTIDGTVTDGAYTSPIPRSYYFGDYNGDGKMELLTISYNSSFKGDVRTSIFTIIDLDTENIIISQPCFSYGQENAGYVYIMDYDGDGKSDVCNVGTHTTDVYSLKKLSNGQSFERICSTNTFQQSDIKGREVQITDYNGDGKQDFVVLPPQSSYYYRPLRVYEFDQGCEEGYEEMKSGHDAYMILRENYPGNRYQLRVCSTNSNSYYVEDLEQTEEILHVDKGDLWEIYLSRGTDSFNYKSMHLTRTKKDMQYVIMDINKDGYPDILQSNSKMVSIYLYKGGVWENTPSVIEDSFRSTPKLIPVNLCNYGSPTDILLIDKETLVSYVFSKNEGKNRLLTGMTDSYGLYHNNYYTEMTSQVVYEPGTINRTYPYNNLIVPLNLIESASIYNPKEFSNASQERYKYNGAVIHRTGLGFCGFTKIEVKDEITGRTTIEERDPEMFGVTVHTISPMIERSCIYQNKIVGKCSNLLITRMTELDKLTEDTTVKIYEYDNFYNPIRETVNFENAINTITEQTYTNLVTQERYILGIPRVKKYTRTRDSEIWIESEEIIYNTSRLPKQKLSKVGNKQVNKTIWNYDTCRNVISESNTPYNATSSTTKTYLYDNGNRYPNEIQDILGRTTYYLSYNKYGVPTVTRDFNQLQTYYSFDDFGRLKSSTYPTGNTSLTYAWEMTIGLYSVTQKTSGKPTQKTYYDILGREIQIATQRFDGSWQYIKKEYDRRGRLSKVSQPFKDSGTIHWTTYEYDNYDRPTSIVEASGKTTTTSYLQNSVTTNENGITKTCEFDKIGLLTKVTDPAGTINYIYRADEQLKQVTAPGDITTSFEYDSYGHRNKIIDPSFGTQTTNDYYNGNKHVIEQTNANGKTIKTEYDLGGRILSQNREEFNTTYSYDPSMYEIGVISSSNNVRKEYKYDANTRVIEEKETVMDDVWLQRNYTYSLDDITNISYKSSRDNTIATEERIYANGYLIEIKLNDISIWKLTEENELGQPIKITTGPLTRTYSYDAYGMPATRQVGDLQNFAYTFDPQTGNLLTRTDKKRNITEQFGYDKLNRLTNYNGNKLMGYDKKGNITVIRGRGFMYYYHPSKPYAISDIDILGNLISKRIQEVSYNSFQRPAMISTNSDFQRFTYKFDYDEKGERVKREFFVSRKVLRYYMGSCYETEGSIKQSSKSFLYIGGDAYSAPAVYVKKNGLWDINYICRDYLGSITHLTNSSGVLLQEISYDAWGRFRNPENQILRTADNEIFTNLGRGYGGHEHLHETGLINMNARLYDPSIGRFLSPDPYIQVPDNSQNFNRYSYCLNNPLIYKDENGEFIFGYVFGFFKGLGKLVSGNGKWHSPFTEGWKSAKNGMKIDWGLFKGNGKQILSRFTWELPQTLIGIGISQAKNLIGQVDQVKYFDGATYVINENKGKSNGMTIGSFINMNLNEGYDKNKYEPNGKFTILNDAMFMHEYGHYIQSQEQGWGYLSTALRSLKSAKNSTYLKTIYDSEGIGVMQSTHNVFWTETSANKKASKYFKDKYNIDWSGGNFLKYPM